MVLPTTKQNWEGLHRLFQFVPDLQQPAEKVIQDCVNWLLERLYVPHPELGARCEGSWLKKLDLEKITSEPINWGSLSCVEVKQYLSGWEVFIEEATPDCPALQAYITHWLTAWGWTPIVVTTEW